MVSVGNISPNTMLSLLLLASSALGGLTVGPIGPWTHPDDTPAFPFTDKDGTFYTQSAHAGYEIDASRVWSFFTGPDIDSLKLNTAITHSFDPNEPRDRNDNTTFRCTVRSPTGRESTMPPPTSSYKQKNFCDLAGMWVDPDTGDWIGLVHNEFTPSPFGDGLHYDAIDRAISKDQGRTWTITEHLITTPFSTKRGDNVTFPQSTYYYGNGDPRVTFDLKGGYVYVFHNSRVVDKGGSWKLFYPHVARARLQDKFTGFKKYYKGSWDQPGVGGKESVLVPTSVDKNGYSAIEYNPRTPGKADEQVAAGKAPATSRLFVLDVTYNAFIGKWIGEPQSPEKDASPQEYYVCDDIAVPKWSLLGTSGETYKTSSWYRWFIDSVSKTSGQITGRKWRGYCSFYCHDKKNGDYIEISHDQADGLKPLSGTLGGYTLKATGDGAYTLGKSGKALGVTERKWGSAATLGSGTDAKSQWWVIPDANGGYRAVNRWSTLVLAGDKTVPARHWDNGSDRVADQILKLQ